MERKPGKGKKALKVEEVNGYHGMTTMEALCYLCESFVKRSNPFSSLLLAEALQRLSAKVASLLIRTFILFINRHFTSNSIQSLKLDDVEIRWCCNWLEALLDSHFTTSTLQMLTDSATREAVKAAIDCVNRVDQMTDSVQNLHGLWSQLSRSVGGAQLQRQQSTALHTIEKVTF